MPFLNIQSRQIKSLNTALPTRAKKARAGGGGGRGTEITFFFFKMLFLTTLYLTIKSHNLLKPHLKQNLRLLTLLDTESSHGHTVSPSRTNVTILIRLALRAAMLILKRIQMLPSLISSTCLLRTHQTALKAEKSARCPTPILGDGYTTNSRAP